MKINDFHVSNFGIFTGAGGPLSKGLTVFYGENESGKTTLMNFFRRVLFSREKHARLKGNPYDPINGGRHGGMVRIAMEDGREYQITLEGGKNLIASVEGGLPTELPPNFFSINRDVYESIFAMGLADMQSLAPLNSSDVAARFFSAGAGLGSASLPRLLSTLEARENELFNPGNARSSSAVKKLLAAMDETDSRLRDMRRVNAGWQEKKTSLKEMEQALEAKRKELAALKSRLEALELLEKGRPSWNVLQDLFRRLKELEGVADFPENGLAHLDSLNREIERLSAELTASEDALRTEEEDLAVREKDPLLECLESRENIEILEHESEQFRTSLLRKNLLNDEIEGAKESFGENLAHLCSWWTEEHLLAADVSADAIAFARETARKLEELERRKGEGEKSLTQWNRLRDDRKGEALSLEKEMSTVENRAARASSRWERLNSLRSVFADLSDEEEKVASLEEDEVNLAAEREEMDGDAPVPSGPMIGLVSGLLLAVAGGSAYQAWLTFDPIWIFGFSALFFASALAFLAHRDQRRKYEAALRTWTNRMEDLESRQAEIALQLESRRTRVERLQTLREELAAELDITGPRFQSQMDTLLTEGEADNTALERFTFLDERSRQMVGVLARMDSEAAAMEVEVSEATEQLQTLLNSWKEWLRNSGFDEKLAPRDMEGLVPRILQLRSELESLGTRIREAKELSDYIDSVRRRLEDLSECFRKGGEPFPEILDVGAIRTLAVLLRRAEESSGRLSVQKRDMDGIRKAMEETKRKIAGAEEAKEKLFRSAGEKSEEGFHSLAALDRERKALKSAILQEEKVLLGLFDSDEEVERARREFAARPAPEIKEERRKSEESVQALQQEMEDLADSRGRLALEVEQIAGDERLSELLFARKEMEQKMDEHLREWISVFLARHFLEVSKARHERERQPEVILRAAEYLAFMTDSRYTLLSQEGEKGLSVVVEENEAGRARKDEVKWSSGLADQVYLSMRLALATLWGKNSEPLPLILDDLLVRFDEGRQRGAAEAIFEAGRHNQVLLFTCQRSTFDVFQSLAEERDTSPAFLSGYTIENGKLIPAA